MRGSEYPKTSSSAMNYINLATMDSKYEADRLAELLSEQGIKARMHDERDMQLFVFFTKPKAFAIVQVSEEEYSRAIAYIQHLHDLNDPVCEHIFSCIECGSLAVEYPQFTRKYLITPLLLEWASNLGLFKKQFYCRKCHSMWPYETGVQMPRISHAAEVQTAPPN